MELLFSFQQISSIGWDLRYLTVLLNLVKEKEQSKEKASSTSLGICKCADSVQDDLHFPACRDRGGYLSWMGTEPASSGRLHCSSCFYKTWTLATDVSISADPGA